MPDDIQPTSPSLQLNILQGAIENTNEAFVTIDGKSRVIFFNRAAERIFGYHRSEVLGRELGHILAPDCRQGHNLAVSRYLTTGRPRLLGHETEFEAMRKNGERFPAAISFSVARVDNHIYFTGIVRDMTETRRLQEELLRNERLAALGQAVAEINHEIKNPLILIGGFARKLLQSAADEESRTKLTMISREVERLESLLNELKDLYTPRSLNFAAIDLDELLEEVISLVAGDCSSRGIELSRDTGAGPVEVEGDREKLKQVLVNLLKNSIEAQGEKGRITVKTRSKAGKVTISISDQGPGIPAGLTDKIFSPFFTTKKKGTGLGLNVSRRIIKDHPGGELTLTSHEGEGTTVDIDLRCRRSEPEG